MLGRLHLVIALCLLAGAGGLELLRSYPSAHGPGAQNASIRENPASYRPVFIPYSAGRSGGSGGWGSGK